jgi:peptide/nickel transport system ATP-binding protein
MVKESSSINANDLIENTLLSIENLSVSFNTMDGNIDAIKDINIKVNKGEVVAIVGESGSGKSVTSMSILKLHPAAITNYTSGKIIFNNIDLLKCTDNDMQAIRGNDIAMIFQEPMTSLNPVMNCGKQIAEAIVQHKKVSFSIALKQTLDLFKEVQLPNPELSLKKYPHELSGGQKQRVMIAMAMSCNPQLLICDEPTTALDVTVQKNILLLIKNLQQKNNMGVLFISHDLGLVKEIADRIVVMYKGAIVEQGTSDQILNNPQHNYTKALLACRPSLYPKGKRLPVVADFLEGKNINEDKTELDTKKIISIETTLSKKIIELKNVSISYPIKRNLFGKVTQQFIAVNEVSFDIYKGETLGLVGESGCGKTTLGRALLKLNIPSKGTILYNGKNISSLTAQENMDYRKDVQIIFQDPYSSLNPRITIGDAINECIIVNKITNSYVEAKKITKNLLEKVELKAEHYNRYPHEFSGGQRQRIVIARALALNPKFVVCDESVSALDVSVQAQILNLLNNLKKQFGFTALFISHDLAVVKYISDRIIVMQKGNIVECNTALEIFNNPQNAYTKSLINAIPGKIAI